MSTFDSQFAIDVETLNSDLGQGATYQDDQRTLKGLTVRAQAVSRETDRGKSKTDTRLTRLITISRAQESATPYGGVSQPRINAKITLTTDGSKWTIIEIMDQSKTETVCKCVSRATQKIEFDGTRNRI